MSGIFAQFNRNGRPINQLTLREMGTVMAHRGPDGINQWLDNSVGLGICRLNTTQGSALSSLPYFDSEKKLTISADVRLDDRITLAKKLGVVQRLHDGLSDHELILLSYEKWGPNCVQHLLGDFAFLIWDDKRKQLYCARDHLGVKPFYYHICERSFVAGSEVRSVLKSPDVPKNINEGRIADFLVYQLEGIDKTSTFFESIKRLPPAHTLVITESKFSIEKYWEIDAGAEIKFASDEEYVEAFKELFEQSVLDRLRCNGPVASMLSGGVDSSTIVATANRLLNNSQKDFLTTYSGVSVNDSQCKETQLINLLIERGNFNATTLTCDDIAKYEEKLLLKDGSLEDLFDAWMTMQRLVYLQAKDHGHRVMLDGVDGDCLHSLPLDYPTGLFQQKKYTEAFSEILGIWQHSYGKQGSLYGLYSTNIKKAFIPESLRKLKQQLRKKLVPSQKMNNQLISQDFAESIGVKSRLEILASHSANHFSEEELKNSHINNIMHPYLTVALERYDRVAASYGVEPRHPLLDKRLVEFSVGIPWNQKVRNGWSKYTLRRVGSSMLPAGVIWRKGWDSINWVFTSKLIQKNFRTLTEVVVNQQSVLHQYIDTEVLQSIPITHGVPHTDEEELMWNMFHLSNWLRFNIQAGV